MVNQARLELKIFLASFSEIYEAVRYCAKIKYQVVL